MLSGKNGPSTNVSSGRQKGRVKVGSIKSGSMEKLHSIVKGGKEARERDLELKRQQQRERELAERAERRKSLSTRKLQHVRRENSNLTESSETGKSHLSQPLSDPEVHHTECCSSPEAVDFAQALSEGESIDRSVSSFEKGDDDIGDNNDDDKSEEILRRRYHTMPNRSPWKPLTPSKGSSSDKIEADVDSPTDTLNDSPQIGRRKATLPRQRIEFLKEVKPSSRTESPPPTDSIVSKQGIREKFGKGLQQRKRVLENLFRKSRHAQGRPTGATPPEYRDRYTPSLGSDWMLMLEDFPVPEICANTREVDPLQEMSENPHLEAFLEILCNDSVVDLEKLRSACIRFIVPSELRLLCWMLLLEVLPREKSLWAQCLKNKRDMYWTWVDEYFYDVNEEEHEEKRHLTEDSLDDNGQRKRISVRRGMEVCASSFHCAPDWTLLKQVSLDANRTFAIDFETFFRTDSIQQVLERVAYVWSKQHDDIGYFQGFGDICVPFILVLARDQFGCTSSELAGLPNCVLEMDSRGMLEANLFWCVEAMVSRMQHQYSAESINQHVSVRHLSDLVQLLMPELHVHFQTLGVDVLHYGYRWLLLLLTREFPTLQMIRIFDFYISHLNDNPRFHIYLSAAILWKYSNLLTRLNSFELCVNFLHDMPTCFAKTEDISSFYSDAVMILKLERTCTSLLCILLLCYILLHTGLSMLVRQGLAVWSGSADSLMAIETIADLNAVVLAQRRENQRLRKQLQELLRK